MQKARARRYQPGRSRRDDDSITLIDLRDLSGAVTGGTFKWYFADSRVE